jgi:hypothetical protein
MLDGNVYYHGVIRKAIVAFGSLFSDIYIDRKQGDSVNGNTVQRLRVPLAYAPKEKWLVRIDQDPTLENHTLTSLPRMSFEIIAYTYDSVRKVNRMQQIKCGKGEDTADYIRTPVPYNIDLSLYIITKTQEDALQVMEQILPYFTPEYTLTINAIDDMNIKMDVPVVLNSVIVSDEYDGDFQTRRFVMHTINFQMKVNLFGPVTTQNVITNIAGVNMSTNKDFSSPAATYTATGDPATGNITESWIDDL